MHEWWRQKARTSVHITLGVSDYPKIRTKAHPGEPVMELTQFRWTMMSQGKKLMFQAYF